MLKKKYDESKKAFGLFLIGLGIAAISLGFVFYLINAPGMFLGLYSGPVLIALGALFMILHKE